MGTPLLGILTNTVSHDEEDAAAERVAYRNNHNDNRRPDIATPQHTQQHTDNDSIPSLPSVPSPYSPPSQSLMSTTEEWMMRRRSRTAATNPTNHRKNHHMNPNNDNSNNKPPALIHTTSSSWHEDDNENEDEEEEDPISLQQKQHLLKAKAECQALSKENYELKHQLQKQTHTLVQRSRDYEERQKALQQKWQSALLQLDKAKAMNHELKSNFQKQLQQAQAQAEDWQEQCQKIQQEHQQQQTRRGKHVKEPMDAACQTDVIPAILPKQESVACQTERPVDDCRSISCQTDTEVVRPAADAGTQTDPTHFASTLDERLARIRDAAERAALVQEHQAALQQMQATHETELERLEKQHEAALAQMVLQARQHVQEQVAEHQHKVVQQHATKLAAMEAQHQAELFRVRMIHCDIRFSELLLFSTFHCCVISRFVRNTKKVPTWRRKSCERLLPKRIPRPNSCNVKWKHALR